VKKFERAFYKTAEKAAKLARKREAREAKPEAERAGQGEQRHSGQAR
jgi:hypothetical protein